MWFYRFLTLVCFYCLDLGVLRVASTHLPSRGWDAPTGGGTEGQLDERRSDAQDSEVIENFEENQVFSTCLIPGVNVPALAVARAMCFYRFLICFYSLNLGMLRVASTHLPSYRMAARATTYYRTADPPFTAPSMFPPIRHATTHNARAGPNIPRHAMARN